MILKLLISMVIDGGLGFACYKFLGCSTGTCPLTIHAITSTIYGAVLGAFPATSFH